VACGFSAQDALDDAALAVVRKVRAGASLGKGMKNRLEYNRLWDEIETELYDVAQGKATDGDATYQKLLADADKLARGGLSKDEDLQALRAYLLAVGTQLGLEDGEADKDETAAGKDDANPTYTEEQRRWAPNFQDIHISHVVCHGARTGIKAAGIRGLDCVHDIDISNCTIIYNKVKQDIDAATAKLTLNNVKLVEDKATY
jgi:hypothetical protein